MEDMECAQTPFWVASLPIEVKTRNSEDHTGLAVRTFGMEPIPYTREYATCPLDYMGSTGLVGMKQILLLSFYFFFIPLLFKIFLIYSL